MSKAAALLFFVFLLCVVWWADTGSMPALLKTLYAFPNGDRLGHAVLYGLLAYLLTLAFPFGKIRLGRWALPLGLALALGVATLEEASQLLFSTRTPDLLDLAAGYLGIYASTWIPCLGAAHASVPKGQV